MSAHEQDHRDADEGLQERQHFASILRAYDYYRQWGLSKAARIERDLLRLSAQHQRLARTTEKVAGMRERIESNAAVLRLLVEPHRRFVGHDDARTQARAIRAGM